MPSLAQGRICFGKHECCHEIQNENQTQTPCINSGPTSPRTEHYKLWHLAKERQNTSFMYGYDSPGIWTRDLPPMGSSRPEVSSGTGKTYLYLSAHPPHLLPQTDSCGKRKAPPPPPPPKKPPSIWHVVHSTLSVFNSISGSVFLNCDIQYSLANPVLSLVKQNACAICVLQIERECL